MCETSSSRVVTSSYRERRRKALTWSVIKRISFKIKPNSYSVDDLMHVWCVTASGIRVLPIGPMLPSSPCLKWGERLVLVSRISFYLYLSVWACFVVIVTHKPCDRRPDCVAVFRRASWGDNCAENHHQCRAHWPAATSRSFKRVLFV